MYSGTLNTSLLASNMRYVILTGGRIVTLYSGTLNTNFCTGSDNTECESTVLTARSLSLVHDTSFPISQLPEQYGSIRMLSQGKGSMLLVGTTRNCILHGTIDLEFSIIVQVCHTSFTSSRSLVPQTETLYSTINWLYSWHHYDSPYTLSSVCDGEVGIQITSEFIEYRQFFSHCVSTHSLALSQMTQKEFEQEFLLEM